ncbi:MAG: transposase [Okeania sp. SIO3B5]|uniref:transposase n=1 Tax=Okeania sp. SIO3B5 TaxID=2607811 RepID=UPI0013FF2175|nr:transposase [Okeania sp. SIO3B5]NEO55600.1 transposase [Okeania sp. SIO3B5]
MPYNPDRPRRSSLRLKGYDYTQPGAYFVTLCTKNRECLFGQIVGGIVKLNEYGRIVAQSWQWLEQQYSYVELDTWVVMPNHLHGIIIITDTASNIKRKPLGRLVGAFKTVSAKKINQLRQTPGYPVWQRDFYDRINRNDRSLEITRQYITENPLKWYEDSENPDRIQEIQFDQIPF